MEEEKNSWVHAYTKKRNGYRNQKCVCGILTPPDLPIWVLSLTGAPSIPFFPFSARDVVTFSRWLSGQSVTNPRPDPQVFGPRSSPRQEASDDHEQPPAPSARGVPLSWVWPALYSPGCNALGTTLRGPHHSPISWPPRQKRIKQPPVTSTLINKNLFSASLSPSPRGPPPVTTLSITPCV